MAIEEEEAPRRPGPGMPRLLNGLSEEELGRYLDALRTEIGRTEAELARRKDVRGAAEALFKRPDAERS